MSSPSYTGNGNPRAFDLEGRSTTWLGPWHGTQGSPSMPHFPVLGMKDQISTHGCRIPSSTSCQVPQGQFALDVRLCTARAELCHRRVTLSLKWEPVDLLEHVRAPMSSKHAPDGIAPAVEPSLSDFHIEESQSSCAVTVFLQRPLFAAASRTSFAAIVPGQNGQHPRMLALLSIQAMQFPRKPSSTCPSCWNGPIRAKSGLLGDPLECSAAPEDIGSSWSGGYAYSVLPAALLFRACFGCVWCRFLALGEELWDARGAHESWSTADPRWEYGLFERAQGRLVLRRDIQHRSERLARPPYAYTTANDPVAAWIRGHARIPDVGSPRTWSMAKACIDQCVRDHSRCGGLSIYASDSTPLPTCLIIWTNPDRPCIIRRAGCLCDTGLCLGVSSTASDDLGGS
ncbi:hypothetical protein C8Q70DRAFT_372570 [Cubamyces menziesii]|nr:hypothetical protein C8Q70DRAFT_372570 [Cubamyces menziesii]